MYWLYNLNNHVVGTSDATKAVLIITTFGHYKNTHVCIVILS